MGGDDLRMEAGLWPLTCTDADDSLWTKTGDRNDNSRSRRGAQNDEAERSEPGAGRRDEEPHRRVGVRRQVVPREPGEIEGFC